MLGPGWIRRSQSPFGNARMSVSALQVSAHGDEDHGLGDIEAGFVVADETPPSGYPAEGVRNSTAKESLHSFSKGSLGRAQPSREAMGSLHPGWSACQGRHG